LFLFFSRFKPITTSNSSRFSDIDICPEKINGGLYYIYGWMKVRHVIKSFEHIDKLLSDENAEELKKYHPHATIKYFYDTRKAYKNNTIYIADQYLFDNDKTYPGCGYFQKLNHSLLLSASKRDQQEYPKWYPSRWNLPPGLTRENAMIYKNEFDSKNLFKHKTYGQEFIFNYNLEFLHWFQHNILPVITDQ
jgi:hypothetical protein